MVARAPVPHVTHPHITHAHRCRTWLGRQVEAILVPFLFLSMAIAWLVSRLAVVRPGVNVTTRSSTVPAGAPTDTGVWFVAGAAQQGPADAAVQVHNMTEFANTYGDRVSYSVLWDALDVFFREGGTRAYIARTVGPNPVKGTHTFADRAGTPVPTIAVDSLWFGQYATDLTVEVQNGVGANTFVLIVRYKGVIVENSGDLATPAAALAWGASSSYIRVRDLASASAAPTNNPAVAAAAVLAGGTGDHTNITDTQKQAAIALFTAGLGPGQVSYPGATTTTLQSALTEHARANNRTAILDAPDSAVIGDLVAAVNNVRLSTEPERAAMFGPQAIVPGIVPGTTRTVPACAAVAGVIARGDAVSGTSVPAAGANGELRYVIDVARKYSDADRQTGNDGGVNFLRVLYGAIRLYGYRTCSPSVTWKSLADQRLRMEIANRASIIGEDYVFGELDPFGHTLAAFGGALTGMLIDYYNRGALYGSSPDLAFSVNVGAQVNTVQTIAAGELHAVIELHMSPYAETVFIEIVKTPITEPL